MTNNKYKCAPAKESLKPKVRCAIYTRKSTEERLDLEFNSLDAQRDSAQAYIASQQQEGWVVVEEQYDDGGFSGGNAERPALVRLLEDVAAGKIDCVVVYKVDRLSRSLLDFARIMETFDKHGVAFVSVTQQFNTGTPMGRLILNVLLSFAQFEREIIAERIRDKIAAQRRRGKWAGGRPVLGYDVDRSGPSAKLVVNADEAARVRQTFDLYLELGTLLPVVEELARRGWKNKAWTTKRGEQLGGREFDKSSLYALLTNPIYIGKLKHKAERFDGEHEAIIEPEIFHKVQSQLKEHGWGRGNFLVNQSGALLKGLLHCQDCQHAMVHTFTGRGSKRYRYYTCTRAIKQGRKSCPTRSLPAAEIERVVVDQIRCLGQDAVLRAEVLRQSQTQTESSLRELQIEQRQLERQLARHQAEIRELVVAPKDSQIKSARVVDLHSQVTRHQQRLLEIKRQTDLIEDGRIGEADIDAAFSDFDSVWKALSNREQAEVLRLLVARVEFDARASSVSISFHPSAIRTLAANNRKDDAA
ncbi:MAG: recombinase family protein [Planctomycetes bacterium]|nr:recombinase family protein [Planctomycetota bacterium]